MALPNFLVLEIRAAFRSCAQQHRASSQRYFSGATLHYQNRASRDDASTKSSRGSTSPQKPPNPRSSQPPATIQTNEEKGLLPGGEDPTAIDVGRRDNVPRRVMPKAQITPSVKMTPRQRLHIEVLTRQQPRKAEPTRVFRERLQIYHIGSFKENFMAVLKVSGLTTICMVNFIFVPAHWTAGTDLWITALIWLGGFVPAFFVDYATKSMVSRVFLTLPTKARESPKAAMEYARNLPADTELDIRYLKPWGLEGSFKARTSELEPTTGTLLKPLSFKLADKYKKLHSNSFFVPTEFFVSEKTALGEQSWDTIPGIWNTVYRQLMKIDEKEGEKWQKKEEEDDYTSTSKPGQEGYG